MHSRGAGVGMRACGTSVMPLSRSLSKRFCVSSLPPSSFPAPPGFSLCLFLSGSLFVLLWDAFRLCVSCSLHCNCCFHAALFHQTVSSVRTKSSLRLHVVGASYIPVEEISGYLNLPKNPSVSARAFLDLCDSLRS